MAKAKSPPIICACSSGCRVVVQTKGCRYAPGHFIRVAPRDTDGRMVKAVAIDLRCRRCGLLKRVSSAIAEHRRTLKRGPDGAATYLCRQCAADTLGVEAFRKGRQLLLSKKHGVSDNDDESTRADAMKEQIAYAVRKAGGYEKVRAASKGHKRTPGGNRRVALGHLANGRRRTGKFSLCPFCRRLVYRPPGRLLPTARRAALGFHGPCWRLWWPSDLAHRPTKRSPKRQPTLPPGAQPTAAELDHHFRWAVRHYGLRESWRAIAKSDSCDPATVRRGARALVSQLPATWRQVYGGKQPGPSLDALLPIDRLRVMAAVTGE